MSGIGARLRQERERLSLSQRAFGEIGGVEANAQGKYESGERTPKGDYLAAVAEIGVDVLYVLLGRKTPQYAASLTDSEEAVINCYRSLQREDQDAIRRLTTTLAELSAAYSLQKAGIRKG